MGSFDHVFLYVGPDKFTSCIAWTDSVSHLHSKLVNLGVVNPVNLPVYTLLSGITLSRAHREKNGLCRLSVAVLCYFTHRMTEYANHASPLWLIRLCFGDEWFGKTPCSVVRGLPHWYFHLSVWLTPRHSAPKRHRVEQTESICSNRCAFRLTAAWLKRRDI